MTDQAAPPALVMLNGFAATRDDWDPTFLEALAAECELIRLDYRGVGGSAAPDGPFSIDDLGADVAGVIEGLGLDRPAVLGWSMGGFVALALALARPDLVGGLVLLSTSSGDHSSTLGAPDVRDRLRDFSGTPREQATRLISLLFPPDRAVEVDARFGDQVAQARSSFPTDVATAQWKAMEAWESNGAAPRLHEISCPTLVATGSEDVVIPSGNALGLASAIDGAWLARFPRCGHAFMADYPRQLGRLITAFLQTVRPV